MKTCNKCTQHARFWNIDTSQPRDALFVTKRITMKCNCNERLNLEEFILLQNAYNLIDCPTTGGL